jgi:hypothetical protein
MRVGKEQPSFWPSYEIFSLIREMAIAMGRRSVMLEQHCGDGEKSEFGEFSDQELAFHSGFIAF